MRITPPPLPSAAPPPEAAVPGCDLQALDYDEPTSRRPTVSPTHAARLVEQRGREGAPPAQAAHGIAKAASTTAQVAPPRTRSVRWFVSGLVIGVLVVTFARGDGMTSMRTVRLWGASTLRSLKTTSVPQLSVPASVGPTSSRVEPPPCSLTDEDCAILMAPFVQAEAEAAAADQQIPLVDVSALPRVRPPVAHVAPVSSARKAFDATPVAQPDDPAPAGGAPTAADPPPKPAKRAPGPFDAPGPVDAPSPIAAAPITP